MVVRDDRDDRLLVTIEEAARMLNIGRSTVYELIAAGKIRAVKIGRSRRVPVAALNELVAREVELQRA